jgi:hypothetical protein
VTRTRLSSQNGIAAISSPDFSPEKVHRPRNSC